MRLRAFGWVLAVAAVLPVWAGRPLSARFVVPEPPEVRALREQVAQLRLAEGSAKVLALLEPLLLEGKEADKLEMAALDLYAKELLAARQAPERLLEIYQKVSVRDWAYQIGFRYWTLVVENEKTRDRRISQLIQLAEKGGFGEEDFTLREWAAGELCSLGVEGALPSIEKVLKRPAERAYCRAQIAAMTEFPDPVDGLRRALEVEDPFSQTAGLAGSFHRWAAQRLDEIGSAKSLHVLAEYGARVAQVDWEQSQQIAERLRNHGWSEETLRLYGYRSQPGSGGRQDALH